MKAFMVAGTQSGVGKTTITVALLAALRARGLRVAPFKAGPDYIDPTHHEAAAGVPSRNLDTWMLPPETVVRSFRRAADRADVAVVEGVMGLFDGKSGEDESGSSAHLAKLLGIPVILVVDARAMARSAGAMVLGYRTFDPAVRVAGVIVNQLASEGHYATTRSAIARQGGVPVFGGIYRDQKLHLPERHLGLVPTQETTPAAFLAEAAALAERAIDIDGLLAVAAEIEPNPSGEGTRTAAVPRVPIAVARDRAFTFYYEDSLELLQDAGAEILPFSPLTDQELPGGSRGVYIGGGFPEVYAEALAANAPMHAALREAHGRGVPIYAECGGHMYLGQSLTDADGAVHGMAGLTPVTSTMAGTRLTLGYRTARALRDGAMFARGETIRGHEFHLSASPPTAGDAACWEFTEPALGPAGYSDGNLWSSYLHIHLGAAPGAATRFANSCEKEQQR
jgi:cobyrinic acid a,c-diamide synthase